MAEEQQMSLEGILGDEERKTPDPVEKQQAERNDAKEQKEQAPAPEKNISRRQAHRDIEQDAQGRVRDKTTGQYVPKDEKKAETTIQETAKVETKAEVKAEPKPEAQQFTDKEKAFLKAAQEERNKRQELERRIAAGEFGKPASTEPAKTFWDDPEAALRKHQDELRTMALHTRLQTAETIARSKYTDFDEKVAAFGEMLEKIPGLHAQWLGSPDPAEFAYRTVKSHQDLQAAGGVNAMRDKIEKETEARVRAKIEAELKAKAEALEKERAALPPSLSTAPSKGVNRPVWGGPTSLTDILKI